MKSEKYDRSVSLMCPTCGSTQFEYGEDMEMEQAKVKCTCCNREMTKDELIQENSENIENIKEEIGKEIVTDAAKEMKEHLQKLFKGNKNIKIR